MFIPNRTLKLRRISTTYDRYGQASYSAPVSVRFALVRYDTKIEDTTVRADSSATKGNTKEYKASGRILIEKRFTPKHGDMILLEDRVFKIKEVEPRYNVLGKLDHYECDFEKCEDKFGEEA